MLIHLVSLSNHTDYHFISSTIEEIKCCNYVMKKLFNKELMMPKKDNEDFEN